MKKIYYLLFGLLFIASACNNDNEDDYKTYELTVQLEYPASSQLAAVEGVRVVLAGTNGGASFDATTDSSGKALFTVPAGVYEASATDRRVKDMDVFMYNGVQSNVVVGTDWVAGTVVKLDLKESKSGQLLIKELYVGGCQKNDGSGVFQTDKYAILYNNSSKAVSLDNVCLAITIPYNAQSTNKDYIDGKLFYETEGWIPAGDGIWFFPQGVTIAPYTQMVVSMMGSIDNTTTYSNSINFANPNYYCMYDPASGYNLTSYYPAPSSVIPVSHYLSAIKYGQATGWTISTTSPAFFLFLTDGTTPEAFANDAANMNYHGNTQTPSNARLKVPVEWILDAVEVFTTTSNGNQKRLTSTVDAGYVWVENKLGYTSYRNVDAEATKAIPDNAAKLVYNYNGGTEIDGNPSTDPSGIDAEASMKAGAIIIYKDTNNSTNDFHQRGKASIKN